jgi:hypothetical protein
VIFLVKELGGVEQTIECDRVTPKPHRKVEMLSALGQTTQDRPGNRFSFLRLKNARPPRGVFQKLYAVGRSSAIFRKPFRYFGLRQPMRETRERQN